MHPARQAFYDFEHDDSMRAAVFHGVGGNFCAGCDLEALSAYGEDGSMPNVLAAMLERGPMASD